MGSIRAAHPARFSQPSCLLTAITLLDLVSLLLKVSMVSSREAHGLLCRGCCWALWSVNARAPAPYSQKHVAEERR